MPRFELYSTPTGTAGQNLVSRLGTLAFFVLDGATSTDMTTILQSTSFPTRTAELTGTDLSYVPVSNGTTSLVGGRINALQIIDDASSSAILVANNLRVDAVQLGTFITADQPAALARYLLRGNDTIVGTDDDDVLQGFTGNDRIFGQSGSDILSGGVGRDRLDGFSGGDSLTGGAGRDSFVFTMSPQFDPSVDALIDFRSGLDRLRLSDDAFANSSGIGALDPDAFVAGAAATTADHRLVYDAGLGRLAWDSDGVGGSDAIVFAVLGSGLTIAVTDVSIF